jgi:phosphatidylglycerophosphate synthase
MFDERVRAAMPRLVGPVARGLTRAGVTPNAMSGLSCALALMAAALIAIGWTWIGFAIWVVSRIGDGLDGLMARQAGRSSLFGGYLDITLDMTAYSGMIVGFAIAYPDLTVAWTAILASYVLSITSTLALSEAASRSGIRVTNTNRTYQFTSSLAEAGETSVVYGAWVVFPQWMEPLAWVWCAVVFLSVIQRTWWARRVLHQVPRPTD